MTCNARKFMSLTIKPEDFHVIDDDDDSGGANINIDKESLSSKANTSRRSHVGHSNHSRSGDGNISQLSQSRNSRNTNRSIRGQQRHHEEEEGEEDSGDEKDSKFSLPSRFFATQNSPRNNAKVVRVKVKKNSQTLTFLKKQVLTKKYFSRRNANTTQREF